MPIPPPPPPPMSGRHAACRPDEEANQMKNIIPSMLQMLHSFVIDSSTGQGVVRGFACGSTVMILHQ
jgi:hypothetical protein